MKNLIYINMLILVFLISNCNSDKNDRTNYCQDILKKTSDYIYNYQIYNNIQYLDSSLTLTNKGLSECDKYFTLLQSRKLDILLKKENFNDAILFVNSFEKPFVNNLSYYINYLIQRFKAMEYQVNGDTLKRNECLKIILNILDEFINNHNIEINNLILYTDVDELLKNTLSIPFIQYYYIKSILIGTNKIKKELDALCVNGNINEEFVCFIYEYSLDNDLLCFTGI